MNRKPKRVQTNPLTFQDWWDKQDYPVEMFKPCREAWNKAQEVMRGGSIEMLAEAFVTGMDTGKRKAGLRA